MTTVSIQSRPGAITDREETWTHVAAMHGLVLSADDLAAVRTACDVELVRRLFADLGDAERQEILWAVAP